MIESVPSLCFPCLAGWFGIQKPAFSWPHYDLDGSLDRISAEGNKRRRGNSIQVWGRPCLSHVLNLPILLLQSVPAEVHSAPTPHFSLEKTKVRQPERSLSLLLLRHWPPRPLLYIAKFVSVFLHPSLYPFCRQLRILARSPTLAEVWKPEIFSSTKWWLHISRLISFILFLSYTVKLSLRGPFNFEGNCN